MTRYSLSPGVSPCEDAPTGMTRLHPASNRCHRRIDHYLDGGRSLRGLASRPRPLSQSAKLLHVLVRGGFEHAPLEFDEPLALADVDEQSCGILAAGEIERS